MLAPRGGATANSFPAANNTNNDDDVVVDDDEVRRRARGLGSQNNKGPFNLDVHVTHCNVDGDCNPSYYCTIMNEYVVAHS